MQFDTPFGELNWKGRGMRTLFLATLNCLVRHKPRVPATTQIVSLSMTPARDVALILIRHAKRHPVQFDAAGNCEMKNVFVAIVQKSLRIDRLEMAKRFDSAFDPHLALRVRAGIATWRSAERIKVRVERGGSFLNSVDGNGFDPVNRVLQHEKLAQRHHNFVGQHRVRRRGADVEKERAVRF